MTTNGTNGINGSNGHHFHDGEVDEIVAHLKNLSPKSSCPTLFHYIKKVSEEVSEEQSFYVLDIADILWKIQLWYESLPGITPYYAVKANADPVLIRLFVLLGFSFDCSTRGEISLVLKHGADPKKIIYAHTIKPNSSLTYAAKVGVDLLTFDTEEELYKIKKNFPTARLVLRIKAETPSRSYDLNGKFGCPVEKTARLLGLAKELSLKVVGVSFHVGALCHDAKVFKNTIEKCHTVFKTAEKLGFHFTLLDLGAGFFGSDIKENFFHEVTFEIKEAVRNKFPDNDVRIIAEPGCYFVGSAQRHVTRVLGTKAVTKSFTTNNSIFNGQEENCDIKRHYYLNEGYYGSFFKHFEIYDTIARPLLTRNELNKRPVYKSKIWGQTCCSEDVIQEECLLPELEAGESIVWENMGAYSVGVASTFTCVPLPIAKRVFIQNHRLNLDWIDNSEEIFRYIAENTTFIEREDFS